MATTNECKIAIIVGVVTCYGFVYINTVSNWNNCFLSFGHFSNDWNHFYQSRELRIRVKTQMLEGTKIKRESLKNLVE